MNSITTKTNLIKNVVIVAAILFALCALYLWFAFTWSYSTGERAGYVQKFSKTGWVCKTWEGELSMMSLPGQVPEKFHFTVRNNTVADKINQSLGKQIALNYDQYKGLPTSCFGNTEFFVSNVKNIE
ncbi:6-phosphogluconate dehydrogenase [Candidatus Nitrotoga sp. AM1P]|nr:6-phosphogluconate dehydrogenase [Candidatus Nitrotoga sp. AM1P]